MSKKIIAIILSVVFCFQCYNFVAADDEMRGVWVTTAYRLDYPSKYTTDATQLKADADAILDNCVDYGFNTVFLQVRPASDAFYKSSIFPWSQWLTGSQGTAPDDDFDPLTYWVSAAHQRGLELHAWINPFVVTKSGTSLESLAETNPAKKNTDYTIKYGDNYYYDPGNPNVRNLILEGVREIVNNYDVDGIHIDDYFYPSRDFADDASFSAYNRGFTDKNEWRRDNINLLIQAIHDLTDESSVEFGVSPVGIWANKRDNELGSATTGKSAYYDEFADTRRWALEGWVDYIMPQIYWEIGNSSADYATLVNWWADTLKDVNTKLYIGMATYKAVGTDSTSVWYNGNEIKKQLTYNDGVSKVRGEAQFRYGNIMSESEVANVIKSYYSNSTGNTVPNNSATSTSKEITVDVNGERIAFDQSPVIEEGRTLVPMRAIFEALDSTVEWYPKEEKVVAESDGKSIELTIGSTAMYVGEELVILEVPAKILSGRTMVPLRAVSEALGAEVVWNQETRNISINK